MPASLRLRITDYQNPDYFRWQLEGPNGNVLADKNVRLDVSEMAYQGYADLPAFLQHYRLVCTETELLAMAGDWIGEHVFGDILGKIKEHETPPLTTVAVIAPPEAQGLLERPLELARLNGKSLTEQKIRLVYEREDAKAPKPKADGDTLRILAVFSLPDDGSPLNLRQERYELQRFAGRLQSEGKAVELRILQYGATRDTLKDALADGEGWDILHLSGHGNKGIFVLEKPDGSKDAITTDELQDLLDETRGRIRLAFLSACLSGATTLQEAWQALGMASPVRDDKSEPAPEVPTAQKTVFPSLGQTLAERLDAAVVAMRYRVGDRFAIDLANAFYDALLTKGLTLPRALHKALDTACASATTATPPLSSVTPILFGGRAADLKMPLAERPRDFVLPSLGKVAFPPEPERFVGRLKPMRLGQETLAPRGSKRGILFHGMAGAGKTTIAAELGHRYGEERFRGFVWHKCPEQGSELGGAFARFLTSLYDQLGMKDTTLLENADRPDEFNRRTLPRLRQYLSQNACLIVLDNLEGLLKENNEWRDPQWGTLIAALLDAQSQSRVVLTSRHIPNSIANLPQLERCSVHALSLPEAQLLAREMPNLGKLFADAEGQTLLQWTLRLVQGHPKLLEFADGIAADREALKAQLLNAESAAEGCAGLQAFFDTGDSTRDEAQFIEAFSFWTRSLEDRLSPPVRLLFSFLACMEEEDRISPILSQAWPNLLERLSDDLPGRAEARADAGKSLQEGLQELISPGLVEAKFFPQSEDAPNNEPAHSYYLLHPAVAETVRQDMNPALCVSAEQTLAWFHIAHHQHSVKHETEGHSANIIATAKRALPYVVRQQEWETVASLAQHIIRRDEAQTTLASVLPLLEQAATAETTADGKGIVAGIVAKTLRMMGRTDEAEERLQALLKQAEGRGDYRVALVRASDLATLLKDSGRYDDALALVVRMREYARQAGAGPWTQLSIDVTSLQIGNELGQWRDALTEGATLLKRMDGLSETVEPGKYEDVPCYNTRESLLSTLGNAAVNLNRYPQVLELNSAIVESLVKRNAGALEIASRRFNDYGPLLRLGRYADARELLQTCREVFADASRDDDLGNVYSALASLENELGHYGEAVAFECQALLHHYRTMKPLACLISHNNLANRYKLLGHLMDAHAHFLATCIIVLQIQSGHRVNFIENLANDGISDVSLSFDWVADTVKKVPGVRFRELFARLPKTAPDGDAAIATVWEMVQQTQAQWTAQQAVAADVPPAVLDALKAQSVQAFHAALRQLPEEQAQAIVQSLTEVGIIRSSV